MILPVRKRRLPLLPASLRLALSTLRLRRAQTGSRQSGQELRLRDAAAHRHLARCELEQG